MLSFDFIDKRTTLRAPNAIAFLFAPTRVSGNARNQLHNVTKRQAFGNGVSFSRNHRAKLQRLKWRIRACSDQELSDVKVSSPDAPPIFIRSLQTSDSRVTPLWVVVGEAAVQIAIIALAITVSVQARRKFFAYLIAFLSVPQLAGTTRRLLKPAGANTEARAAEEFVQNEADVADEKDDETSSDSELELNAASSALAEKAVEEAALAQSKMLSLSIRSVVSEEIESLRYAMQQVEQSAIERENSRNFAVADAVASLDTNMRSLRRSIETRNQVESSASFPLVSELELVKSRLKRSEQEKTELEVRLGAAEANFEEAKRAGARARQEADEAASRELILRTELATVSSRLLRLDEVTERLRRIERRNDELEEQVISGTREQEGWKQSVEDAEQRLERIQNISNVLRKKLEGLTGRFTESSSRKGSPRDESPQEAEERFWQKRMQSRGNLGPDSILYEELLGRSKSGSGKIWPSDPLGSKKKEQKPPIAGLPADGGFGGGENPSSLGGKDVQEAQRRLGAQASEAERIFSFSRGEFDESKSPVSGDKREGLDSESPDRKFEDGKSRDEAVGGESKVEAADIEWSENSQSGEDVLRRNSTIDTATEIGERFENANPDIRDEGKDDVNLKSRGMEEDRDVLQTMGDAVVASRPESSLSNQDRPKASKAIPSRESDTIAATQTDEGEGNVSKLKNEEVQEPNRSTSESLQTAGMGEKESELKDKDTENTFTSGLSYLKILEEKRARTEENRKANVKSEGLAYGVSTSGGQEPDRTHASEGTQSGDTSEDVMRDPTKESREVSSDALPKSNAEKAEEVLYTAVKQPESSTPPLSTESDEEGKPINTVSEKETGPVEDTSGEGLSTDNTIHVSKETKDDARGEDRIPTSPDEPEENTVAAAKTTSHDEDVKAEEPMKEETALELVAAAGELSKKARRRGLAVSQADALFKKALGKLDKALKLDENKAFVEGEYGGCLLAWAKVNVADAAANWRLGKALNFLTSSMKERPGDETTLFNAGLCLCLLASTSEKETAVEYYGRACKMYEELLTVNPGSRIGCFNCGLAYTSLGRLSMGDGSVGENTVSYIERAAELFQRSLELKPGDSKALSYLDDCQRQLSQLRQT